MKKNSVRGQANHRPAKSKNQSQASASLGEATAELLAQIKAEQLLTQLVGPVCAAESIAAAKEARMSLSDWVSEAVSREPVPQEVELPPLRGEPAFPHYTVDQVAHLPCGAARLRTDLFEWWEWQWDKTDAACNVHLKALSFYEALRHHPYFQREAAALRNFMESQRELSALLKELDDKREGARGLTPSWPMVETSRRKVVPAQSGAGEVAA